MPSTMRWARWHLITSPLHKAPKVTCLFHPHRVKETLSQEVLSHMHAPGQSTSIPFITPDELAKYDAFLLGVPTRYGNFPAQWKAFWDQTGKQWQTGGYYGKYVGLFISTASQGGGQESTALAAMSTFAHHGLIYVPLGYATAFGALANLTEVRGGSAWGAGTFAVSPSSSHPSSKERPWLTGIFRALMARACLRSWSSTWPRPVRTIFQSKTSPFHAEVKS